jgi:drug/metabolite transporter (DMT)-like permease
MQKLIAEPKELITIVMSERMKALFVAFGVGLIFVGLALVLFGYFSSINISNEYSFYWTLPAWQGFQADFYLGLALTFIGIVLTVYGALSKKIPPPPSNP